MSRCDYDTIFQRVFCVTLIAIALTFTVIITNVFVDIDGLLTSKDKSKTFNVPVPVLETEVREVKVANLIRPETFYKEEKAYDEANDENYRSKRSLESNFLFHVKNPKIKSILSNRLATLLEELDAEENVVESKNPKNDATNVDIKSIVRENDSNKDVLTKKANKNEIIEKTDEEDMLHLAMHNILLQGIIGHMDLNDVYKKVHSLVTSFKDKEENSVKTKTEKQDQDAEKQTKRDVFGRNKQEYEGPSKPIKELKRSGKIVHNPSLEESKIFEELIKCEKLQNDITNSNQIRKNKGPKEMKPLVLNGPKLLIKTIIDITSNKQQRKEPNVNSIETIKGIVKLIYNGKSVQFSKMDEEDQQAKKNNEKRPQPLNEKVDDETQDIDITELLEAIKNKQERTRSSNSYFNKILDEYFKKYPKTIEDRQVDNVDNKRLKRHIQISYSDDAATTLSPLPKTKKDDDQLFVEIETHFDSKGMKAEKRKKLIRNIIDKIQKVIHGDINEYNDEKKRKHKHDEIKKRNLSPLGNVKKMLMNKMMQPMHSIDQRHSDPISKAVPVQNPLPFVSDKSGETWKKIYNGPGFLTASKSVNSAEIGEIDVDYNKITPANGIPQRLQKPLNSDVSEEMLNANANTYIDMGNLKFIVQDIDGTGLSIAFNQYTDEAPDPEAVKRFTGMEELVNSYHQNEGKEVASMNPADIVKSDSEERDHQLSKRDAVGNRNEHVLIRRSVKETHNKDYPSNEYNIFYNKEFLPYNSYQEIYENKKKRVAFTINKETENINTYDRATDNVEIIKKNIDIKELPELIDEKNNIFYKKLKPSEILSIASLLDRKKRSANIQKITNLNKKIKVNRYLNTHAMGRKKIILKKKRSKRQIDKIRIIATDRHSKPRDSEENIFLVGDENLLADRAIIREVETPEAIDMEDKIEEQYDMIPVMYEEPSYATHVFEGRSRHNLLMSKYPHIILEEISKSKEQYEPTIISNSERKSAEFNTRDFIDESITEKSTNLDTSVPKLDDFVNAIEPKQNYKMTVKIFPKNVTSVDSGFKEVHASINKSYNKGGLRYSSLVNVSEISKIEDLNNKTTTTTTPPPRLTTPSIILKHIKDQQNRMDMLLKEHKKSIDIQLDRLKKEKVAVRTLQKKVTEHLKPDEAISMTNDDVSKLVASALLQIQSNGQFATIIPTSTTVNPTTESTTIAPTSSTKKDENINTEILNQINRNTQLLQTFMQKLTDKLSLGDLRPKSEEAQKNAFPDYWKSFQQRPVAYDPKNASQVPIPLVYAFHQPYPMNNLNRPIPHLPIANVAYHGHIHTNTLVKNDGKCKENAGNSNNRKVESDTEYLAKAKYILDDMDKFTVQPIQKEITALPVKVPPTSTTVTV